MFAEKTKSQEHRHQIWPRVALATKKTGSTRGFWNYFVITVLVLGWGCAAGFFYWRTTPTYALFKAAELFLRRDEKSFKKWVDVPSIVHHAEIELDTLAASEADQHSAHSQEKPPPSHNGLTGASAKFKTKVDHLLNDHFHPEENVKLDLPGKSISESDKDILKVVLFLGFYLAYVDLDYVETKGSTGHVGFLLDLGDSDKKISVELRLEKRPDTGWVLTECKNFSSIFRVFSHPDGLKISQKKTYSIKSNELGSKVVWLKTLLKALLFIVFFRWILRRLRIYRIDPSVNSNGSRSSSGVSASTSIPVIFQFGLAFKKREFLLDFPFGIPADSPRRAPTFAISRKKSIELGHEKTINTEVDSRTVMEPTFEVPRGKESEYMPRGVEVDYTPDSIRLVYHWREFPPLVYKIGAAVLVLAGIKGFSVVLVGMLPDLSFLVVWLFFCFIFAWNFLNKTMVEVSSLKVDVRHHPFPWCRNRKVDTQTLRQVYAGIQKKEFEGMKYHQITVFALLKDGRKIKLLDSGLNREKAMFIADFLQKHLQLEPHSVDW